MIKCTECGYENMDGLDYCDGCGAKLNPTAAGAAPAGGGAAAPSTPAAEPQQVQSSAAATEVPASGAVEAEKPSEAPTGEIKPQPSAEHAATEATQTSAPAAVPATTTEPAPSAAPAAGVAPFKAKLVITRGTIADRKGHEFPLEDGNNLMGRWDPETGSFPEVDLEQDDPEAKISRKHALLRIDNGKITVEDIGSLNGTYVNRNPRLQPGNPVELKNGDEIIIGKTFLKLVVEHLS